MGAQHDFEFFGPHGPALLLFALPAVVLGLVFACNGDGCLSLYPTLSVPGFPAGARLFSWEALAAFSAWFGAVLLLHLVLPGRRAEGVVLPNGGRLTYKLNGGWTGQWAGWAARR